MPEMKTLNGYEIVDAKARQAVANIKHPTKLSEFENDVGYLTQHQDISGKADKGHKHTLSDVTDYVAPDLTPYALKSDIPSHEGLATEEYVDSTKLAILDIYNCETTAGYMLTDNVKNIVQRLWNGERFPIVVAPYSHLQYVPSSISVTSDKIKITLDTSHGTTGGKLTQLSTDTYVFTNTNGSIKLEVQQSSTDVVDSYEYSQQLAALEARVAALEGK